jgi:ADP-ribosyl-[dinitrogen reductase] hydrolase
MHQDASMMKHDKFRETGIVQRARGCLMGQLVGDALGSMVEFMSAQAIGVRYPGGLRLIGPSPVHQTIAGQPTDDSELALALARSLMATGSFDDEVVAQAYADWLDSGPFDCGNTIRQAADAMRRARTAGLSLSVAGRAAANQASMANGALMRQSPLAIWGCFLPPGELAHLVRADTTLTHPNRACQDASAAFIVAMAAVIGEGLNGAEAYKRACAWHRQHGASPTVTVALEAAAHALPAFERNQGLVQIALQNAFYQALHASSLEQGVVDTVMHGGDTDTNAAIAGALLGAIHGVDAIPEQWREAVLTCQPASDQGDVINPRPTMYWPTDALQIADALVRAHETLDPPADIV